LRKGRKLGSRFESLPRALAGKVAVIFGATGYVGQGATDAFLNAGATVIAVGRDLKKLEEFKTKLAPTNTANLHLQTGDFSSEESVKTLHTNIHKLLAGKPIDRSLHFAYSFEKNRQGLKVGAHEY
jgi:NAD(P)-dependent dehydrogenase (short-subunit alcohol dehydrogenase family)